MSTHNHQVRPQLKNAKSTFVINSQMNGQTITDDRVREYLRTEILVKEWIEAVLQIKLTDNLYESLRNGVALCYLVNTIREEIVPTIVDGPNSKDFHFQDNIHYLRMAIDDLNIPKYKQFLTNDLFNGENMVRVIMCLVELSKLSTIQMKPMNNQIPVQLPQGDALAHLKSLVSQIRDPNLKTTKGPKRMGINILKAHIALLAGADFEKCERGVVKFQLLWKGHKQRKIYRKLKRDVAHRERVVNEIVKTETGYVDSLQRCINGYMEPLSKVLSKEQIKYIFSDIKIIKDFGEKILALVNEKVKDWKTYQKVGDAFILIAEVLKVYTNYVQNFDVALSTLDEIKKQKQISALITECREGPITKGFEIAAFLIMPIQRVPRYSMLLTDLVKHTAKDHPDYESLVKSEVKMKAITSYLNEKKREGENLVKFSEIQSSLIGKVPQLCTPSRRFVKEGVFTELSKKKSDVMIYLFNDMIVYGKPSSNKKVKYQGQMELNNIQVLDTGKPTPSTFHIQAKDTEKTVLLSVSAKDAQEKSDWVNEINSCIKLLINNQKSIDILLNPSKVEEQEKLERLANQTPVVPVEQPKSIEEQLKERRMKNANPTPQSPNTTNTTTPQSQSLPNSPLQSSEPTTTTTTTNTNSPSTGGNLQSSFISSLFSNKKKSNRDTLSAPSSPLSSSPNGTMSPPPLTDSQDSNNKSAAKNNRPTKNHKKTISKDDSDIGKSTTTDGNRSRSSTQSRLSKLAGNLTFRRKKNSPLEIPEDGGTPPSEPIQPLSPSIKIESVPQDNNNNSNNNHIDLTQSLPTKLPNENGAPQNLQNIFINNNNTNTPTSSSPNRYSASPKNSRFSSEKRNSNSNSPVNPENISAEPPTYTVMEKLLSYDEIQSQKKDLDLFKLECYLSNEEFKRVFTIDRDTFYRHPKWKQEKLKMEKKLL